MADNIAITAGAGTTVSTEELTTLNGGAVSAQHAQRVILASRTADATVVDLVLGGNGALEVEGCTAHDSADAGFPLKVGGRAVSAPITAVATGDRVDAIHTLHGAQLVQPFALPQSALTGTASSTGTGDTAVIAAQGAGTRIHVTTLVVYNDSTTNTFVNIKDGATTRLVVPAPAKGGATIALPFPLRLSDNTALNFASAAGVTTMYVSAVGYAGL